MDCITQSAFLEILFARLHILFGTVSIVVSTGDAQDFSGAFATRNDAGGTVSVVVA